VPQVLGIGAIDINSLSSEVSDEATSFGVSRHDPHPRIGFKRCCVACQVHDSQGWVEVVPVGALPGVEHDVLAVPDAQVHVDPG